jgi:hypothetical protein
MTYAEIIAAFTEDLLNRRLSGIEQSIGRLARTEGAEARRGELLGLIRAGEPLARLAVRSGAELSRANAEAFRATIGDLPAFYLSATPEALDRRAVEVERDEVRELFRQAPDSRLTGWVVTNRYADIERFGEGIRYRRATLEIGVLELLTNGHMTYGCALGESFYWRQSAEEIARQPRLWPYAVIEYPLSFLKLFRAVADLSALREPFHIRLEYHSIRGHILPPGAPTQFGFIRGHEAVPYPHQHLVLFVTVGDRFDPERITYDLVQEIYATFGYGSEAIPFWDREHGRFDFPAR